MGGGRVLTIRLTLFDEDPQSPSHQVQKLICSVALPNRGCAEDLGWGLLACMLHVTHHLAARASCRLVADLRVVIAHVTMMAVD